MAKLQIDISGRRGLVERHQGDVKDTTSQPNLRYLGEPGQFAEGIFDPIKKYGYLNPANNVHTNLTGTIADNIISIQYDPEGDVAYFAENGENILKLDGLDDISLANYLSIESGSTIKDMVLYEVNGKKALAYIIDTGTEALEIKEDTINSGNKNEYFGGVGGMTIGVSVLGTEDDDHFIEAQPSTPILNVGTGNFISNTLDDGTAKSTKLAQPFNSDETIPSKKIRRVGLRLIRRSGTGAGITLKLTLQKSDVISSSPYTNKGAWTDATSYSVNDVVAVSGTYYLCVVAHTSSTSDRPETGANDGDYWNAFGSSTNSQVAAPDGNAVATATVSGSSIPDTTTGLTYSDITFNADTDTGIETVPLTWFDFGSDILLDIRDFYWLVLEEDGANMTSSDQYAWVSTVNNNSVYNPAASEKGWYSRHYDSDGVWYNDNPNNIDVSESRYFVFARRRADDWSQKVAAGKFVVDTGSETFLYLAENALLYWFVGNKVHTADGGITGGTFGRVNKDVLSFPSYLKAVDVTETRSRMYIGLTDAKTSVTNRYRNGDNVGVFVWDRSSQVFGGTDFYRAPGARELKKIFRASTGDIFAITVGNSGFSELRAINGNRYDVIHTFEREGYPVGRRSVDQINGMSYWTGKNGIKYAFGSVAPGEALQLYKIGDESASYGANPVQGATAVLNEAATPETAVLSAWKDDTSSKVAKWYPHGDGTLDSVAQTGNTGNVYTSVQEFPAPVNVRWGHIFFLPVDGSSATTTAATIKVYYNKSATASKTFTVQYKDLSKGYFYMPLGKKNTYAIQFEIEFNNTATLGSYDFQPNRIVVDYDENKKKKQ